MGLAVARDRKKLVSSCANVWYLSLWEILLPVSKVRTRGRENGTAGLGHDRPRQDADL